MAQRPQASSAQPKIAGNATIGEAVGRLSRGERNSDRGRLVAPLWHTFVLLAVFGALVAIGMRAQLAAHPHAGPPTHLVSVQLQAIAFEWTTFAFVWLGLRIRHTPLREIMGSRWASPGTVLVDLTLALVLWAMWAIGSKFVSAFLGAESTLVPFPTVPLEAMLAIVVAISAAICEETVFRGYFQRQFSAVFGSTLVAVIAQAIVFGTAHMYQGARTAALAGLYGLLFGALASWRKSLRPGMFAHALSDISARLLQF